MKKEIEIDTTPDELAEMFINWGSDDQAKFINLIGEHFKKSDFNAEMQCCYMAEEITKSGKDFLFTLANFVKCQKIKPGSPHESTLINSYECDSL